MTEDRGVAPPAYLLLNLPQGAAQGYFNVTLGYILAHAGVSVAAIAGLISLNNLPSMARFVAGPVIDLTLTPKRWYTIALLAVAAHFVAIGMVPATPAGMPVLAVLALTSGITFSMLGSCLLPIVGRTAPCEKRGAISGWQQAGNLGGIGLGGGAGLWIATRFDLPTASAALAAASLLCGLPMLYVRTPPRFGNEGPAERIRELWGRFVALLRTRSGILALVFNLLPINLGVAVSLFGALAIDWHASPALTGAVTGLIGGAASMAGCVAGGLLAGRLGSRATYLVSGLATAAAAAAMALAPHTPPMFALFVLLNSFLLGIGWASLQAVIYDELGDIGGATVGSLLSSASNVPVVVFTALLGAYQARGGSNGLLLAEAGLAVASVAALLLLLRLWPAKVLQREPSPPIGSLL